ncbi:Endoglucanase E-4 [Blattella germanica]|nr:Endoglucanase E-4 [Blattella germanica]
MKFIFLILGGLALCQASYDYGDLINKSLLFYEAQRSGKLPSDQLVTWRKDSALNDKGQNGEDLTGGYYDGAVEEARKAIKWGTDYLLKAHVSQNTLYGQVGNGGSDLAAETAAALAAASLVFKTANPSYSSTLLTHAKQLSGSYNDELVWGAIWLYKATGDQAYLTKAEQYYDQFELLEWDGRFDWDSKISGVEVLLGQITKNSKYTNKVKGYCDWMVNNQQKTSKGLIYIDTWGTLRHAANVAFICLEAASAGINTSQYRSFAQKQINYMLGDAGRSYVVGYGNNPPSHEQHRSSSCPDAPATCDWNTYNGGQPNAHVLYGALVGGPDSNDYYQDIRQDYVHNEVACDYNAGFQSALAALNEL